MTAMNLNTRNYRDACRATVSIGTAIPGMGLHLVGGSHADEGELGITGPQLATGYWHDAARTEQAFRPLNQDGATVRGYFTGDWAERVDGRVYFKDRLDFQVKVHGYRLELDEVAAAIRDCGWPTVCVVKWNESVAAVIEQIHGKTFNEAALQAALALKIEPYAIPTLMRVVPRIPRNDNDKLDRNAVVAWLKAEETSAATHATSQARRP
jgi:D-alanine--poly(phosphoribitol) ligase subunit 1